MPEAAEAQAAVDGEDGRAWHLPLPPLNATSLPEPYSPGWLLHAPSLALDVHGQCHDIIMLTCTLWPYHKPDDRDITRLNGNGRPDVVHGQVSQQPFVMGDK